jgi:hypothetical protein
MIEIVGIALNQWDINRAVRFAGVDADKAHFANKGDSVAVIIDISDSEAKIPNFLLQTGKQLCVYAVKDGVTVESKTFSVRDRQRPENYVYDEDRRNYIYELIDEARKATAAAYKAAETANPSAEEAQQAAANANKATDSATEAAHNANTAAQSANDAVANMGRTFIKTVNGAGPDEDGNVVVQQVSDAHINDLITAATDGRITCLEDELEALRADLNYKNIDITAFSCPGAGTYEMGSSVAAPMVTWSLNKTPASQSLNGEALGVDVRSKAYDGKLTSSKTYTLTVKGQKGETATKTGTFTFYNGVYWGAIADGATIDDAAILKLAKELRGDRKKTFTANAGAGQRIIYAFPSRYGTPTFNVGGFEGGFYKANAFPIMFTNGSQYAEGYDVWLSDELGNGETKVTVS